MQSRHLSVTSIGGPETLHQRVEQIGEPGNGQALVRIEAAGVSFGDILIRLGVIPGSPKPPFTPGFDFAGVVEKVGPGVDNLEPGQPVAALVQTGGYSEHLIVPADRLVPRPKGANAVESAAVALNYFIAYQMLHRVAEVKAGMRILVHGASGGVGVAFLQLAQLAGIEVYGSASASNLDLVRKFGGHPIDYRTEDFVDVIRALPGGSVYAAFDAIGGSHFNKSSSVIERGGILVAYGQSAALVDGQAKKAVGARGFLGGIVLPKLVPNGKRSLFYNAWSLEKTHPHAYREDLAAVLDLLAQGKITPIIAKTVPLEQAPDAQRELERGTAGGKIVLTPGESA
nr:putative dehydrogenase [Kibdelosporangium sp. MJ126-NF4]CTQ97296.1 putative dehydrogenase [Kibdelosporangium sp. MJ126-NF4]